MWSCMLFMHRKKLIVTAVAQMVVQVMIFARTKNVRLQRD